MAHLKVSSLFENPSQEYCTPPRQDRSSHRRLAHDARLIQSSNRPSKSDLLTKTSMQRVHCYEDLQMVSTSDELQLNFDYKKPSAAVTRSRPCSPISSSSSSDLLSVPDMNLTLSSLTRPLLWNAPLVFTKYFPIDNPLALDVPSLLLNDKDPAEWEECQAALVEKTRSRLLPSSLCSASDTTVIQAESKKKRKKKKHSLRRLFSCTSNQGNSPTKPSLSQAHVVPSSARSAPTHGNAAHVSEDLPKLANIRFNNNANILYIKAATDEFPQLTAALYGQFEEPMNLKLCKIKTELAVCAMQSFFHPYSNVHCSWQKNLQSHILDQLQEPSLQAKFTRIVYLRRFEALLVVSHQAGALLRHKSLAFLHTLSDVLQISPHKLLVLVQQEPRIEPKRLQLSDDED